MSLPSPHLDDRSFQQLLDQARTRIVQACPEWTDLTPHDPGMVLLEAFAHLTETMLYRLNRLPEKAYVEFLRLLGVRLQPPAAASVALRFSVSRPAERPVDIPRGTRVTLAPRRRRHRAGGLPHLGRGPRSSQDRLRWTCWPTTASRWTRSSRATARASQGSRCRRDRPPIVAPTGDSLDLVVGVEADAR